MKPPDTVAVLSKHHYIVRNVAQSTSERLTARYHYARGCSKTAVFRHGLFHALQPRDCVGVAHWLPPTRGAAEATWDGDFREVIALSRLVLVPDLPQNAASFLIGQSIKIIKRDGRFRCLVTYADTWQGHDGAIYRATNWEYMGMTDPRPTWVDVEGRMVATQAGAVTRTRAQMEALGYRIIGSFPKHKYRMVLPQPRYPMPRGQLTLRVIA